MRPGPWLVLPLLTAALAAQPEAVPVKPAAVTPPPALDPQDLRPYEKVITGDARTRAGLFKVHEVKGKWYFEIPTALLGRELLLVATMAQAPEGVFHAGLGVHNEVVRFVRHENRILFQSVSHGLTSDPAAPIAAAVAAGQRDVILMSFTVETVAKSGDPVIEVTRLFTSEVGDFTARRSLNATGLDGSRSYVDRVKVFPGNLRVDAVQTYHVSSFLPGTPSVPGQPNPAPRSATVLMAYSFLGLPEQPMRGRSFDDRVGYWTVNRRDYGSPEHESKVEQLITRWRLEKKDPAAALSEPVKPIVWYIDKATPTQWVPYVKKGVEAWNPAFEAAGFKHAIQARPFPTAKEDPEFDPEDARYSIIRWVPSPVPNAYGPYIADPRSGEILNADLILVHNILQLQRDWYFTQVSPVDPRARKLPLPDDLMGELLAAVVTHECGHALGFPHNMKASSTYPFEKLRDPAWLKEMGHTPSIMDYCRFNYLVQPEDGLDPELLRPRVGPYDVFAVKWGYTPIPDAKTPGEEQATLKAWCLEQDTKPWLRFSTPGALGTDSGENAEAVGDADAVKASTLGFRNLRRVLDLLPAAVARPGESDETLRHLYGMAWTQWTQELLHVAAIVGGFQTWNKHQGQPGPRYTPESRARQEEAVRFLNEHLFRTPDWLLPPALLNRLPPDYGARQLLSAQRRLLQNLIGNTTRTQHLQAAEVLLGDQSYRLADLLNQLHDGIFPEHPGPGGRIDPYRRNLQRTYLDVLGERLNRTSGSFGLPANLQDDARAQIRAELQTTLAQLSLRISVTRDKGARTHLEDLKAQIPRILEPKWAPPPGSPLPPLHGETACWPDEE